MYNYNSLNESRERAPAVSIRESERGIILSAEMPGLEKENVGLEVNGDELTISGKRVDCMVPDGYTLAYGERNCSGFFRKFKLNVAVDLDSIDAEYKDGVLKVIIPRSENAKPKKIAVK